MGGHSPSVLQVFWGGKGRLEEVSYDGSSLENSPSEKSSPFRDVFLKG